MKRNYTDKIFEVLPLIGLVSLALIFLWCTAISDKKVMDAAGDQTAYASVSVSYTQPIYTSEPTSELVPTATPAPVSLGVFKVTAYCPCEICCSGTADGLTSLNKSPVQGRTVAADVSVVPYGTEVIIDGQTYIVEDCGVIGNTIDIFYESHREALDHGVKYIEIYTSGGDK